MENRRYRVVPFLRALRKIEGKSSPVFEAGRGGLFMTDVISEKAPDPLLGGLKYLFQRLIEVFENQQWMMIYMH